ncbi:hypothetical protein RHECNPAF_4310017 [Rhizobium etli CNPAF512]|nr:hypothetical protein RHECNPAF_4310017 [Rhizobium etli CNPAF512]
MWRSAEQHDSPRQTSSSQVASHSHPPHHSRVGGGCYALKISPSPVQVNRSHNSKHLSAV